jgi:hypothetical protein
MTKGLQTLPYHIARSVWLVGPLILCLSVSVHGFPTLFHDWAWPYNSAQLFAYLIDGTSGWVPKGIGHPDPVLNQYFLCLLITALGSTIGAKAALICFIAAIGGITAFYARRLARDAGTSPLFGTAIAIFAVLNPWVYTQLVAGHLQMILAYGSTIGILAELLRPKPSPRILSILLITTLAQLQFYLIDLVLVFSTMSARRGPTLPTLFPALVVGMPVFAGIAFNLPTLALWHYVLQWEYSQSIDPLKGLLLQGYFAQYTDPAQLWFNLSTGAMLVLVILGILRTNESRVARWLLAGTLCALLASEGLRGPAPMLFQTLVLHVHASALFRELYDLVGFAAVGYIALASFGSGRASVALPAPFISAVALASAAMSICAWLVVPPYRYWVSVDSLPSVAIDAPHQTRFALMPPFQPLRFEGHGSGIDPDAYLRSDDVAPMNDYLPDYPAGAALARYYTSNDPSELAALSVSTVIVRPHLEMNVASLNAQNGMHMANAGVAIRSTHIDPVPEMTLLHYPVAGALDNTIGAGNVFFADEPTQKAGLSVFDAPSDVADPKEGWVQASLLFTTIPPLAQGLGGVATAAHTPYPLAPGQYLLADIRGSLRLDDGKTYQSTGGYRWLKRTGDAKTAICSGFCVLVATSQTQPPALLNPPARSFKALDFSQTLPWLATVDIPAGDPAMLRYNVSFDPAWLAIGSTDLTHVRVDLAVNGWLVPKRQIPQHIILIEWVAALQALLECLAIAMLLQICVSAGIRRFGARRGSNRRTVAR